MNKCTLPRYTLLCPGPVNVQHRVALAYSRCALSHREDSFSILLSQVQRDLLFIAGVHAIEAYSALIITGSGTAANEAVLTSAVPPDALVIVLSNGEFGERLAVLSATYNTTEVFSSEWGEDLNLRQLEQLLANTPRALVAMVHHGTSTGLLNPIGQVGRLCKRYGAKLFVDAVSSFAADPISLEDSGITFLSTSSGKATASYPGLSIVLGKNEDFARLGEYPAKNHYLNLYRYFQASIEDRLTPNTPAVSLIVTLHKSLLEIAREGLSQRYLRLCELASYMRAELAARELYKPTVKPQSVILTNAFLPDKLTFADLQLRLKAKGFVIYDAKGLLRGRFFQVSIIGDITIADIDRFLSLLTVFRKSGLSLYGTGIRDTKELRCLIEMVVPAKIDQGGDPLQQQADMDKRQPQDMDIPVEFRTTLKRLQDIKKKHRQCDINEIGRNFSKND